MAKYSVGQAVKIAFNPPKPDLRVPDQVNGRFPGRGDFQTKPLKASVVEVRETPLGVSYLVDVELEVTHDRGGRPQVVKSLRKRVVSEDKLEAA